MVQLSQICRSVNPARRFVDRFKLILKAGHGGNGNPSYGGVGGKGGDIIVEATAKEAMRDLQTKYPNRKIMAGTGTSAGKRRIVGLPGADVVIQAPVGVTVTTMDGQVLGDLNKPLDRVLAARGGAGGCEMNNFIGSSGEARTVFLDLKLLADIGLVGFPNAGKSTMLRALSRAKPKIANYPFTTLEPQIGIMAFPDTRKISIADLPGLIEGAHINLGLGHKFLKHVERTKLLMFVIDIGGFQLSPKAEHRSAFENIVLLNKELELYKDELLRKPAVLVINKVDKDGAIEASQKLKEQVQDMENLVSSLPADLKPDQLIQFDDILTVSGRVGTGMAELRDRLRQIIDYHWEQSLVDTDANAIKRKADEETIFV